MYYDLLAKIKNTQRGKKESFLSPFSKNDFLIAKILTENGYLKDVQKKVIDKKNFLEMKPLYKSSRPALNDFKIVSKPSRHLYFGFRKLRPVKNGYGIGIISTSSGIMTDKEARKKKVGGKYLFQVW